MKFKFWCTLHELWSLLNTSSDTQMDELSRFSVKIQNNLQITMLKNVILPLIVLLKQAQYEL